MSQTKTGMKMNIPSVDEYISNFSAEVQKRLEKMRNIIKETAPEGIEIIAYGMPAYKLNKKPLVYFGGFSRHIGFYATPTGHEEFKTELSIYKQGKGSVQFPHNESLPVKLIEKIVRFKVYENNKMIDDYFEKEALKKE